MKLNQVTNIGKEKRKANDSIAKTSYIQSKSVNKHLHGNRNKKIKVSYINSELGIEAKVCDNTTKKQLDMCNEKKLQNCSKMNEITLRTETPLSNVSVADTDTPGRGAEKYHGTNGSGVTNKKHHVESGKKSLNVGSEEKILLTRIERKAVCSNWKLFREIIGKDDSTGPVPEFKRKKPFNNTQKAEMKKNNNKNIKLDKKKINSQEREMSLKNGKQDLRYSHINGELNQQKTPSKYLHKQDKLQKNTSKDGKQPENLDIKNKSIRLTKEIALDCEMVGTDDKSDMVARVSLVNKFGECVYDKYVAPTETVHDYRTWVSGIRPENLKNAEEFKQVQKEVAELLQGRLLVGHAVRNDLKVLFLSHPRRYTRDTQRFKLFRELAKTKRPSLKKLALAVLNISIQEGEHSSVEDARVAMQLYMIYKKEWEKLCRKSRRKLDSKDVTVSSV